MPPTCAFPGQPGVVGWPGGLVFLKDQLVDYNNNENAEACASNPPPVGSNCMPRFQHGKKDSYHYVVFGNSLGLPNWALRDASLATQAGCPGGNPCVLQSHNTTVTFKTSTPLGLTADPTCTTGDNPLGRVTVAFEVTNPNLN